MRSALCDLFKRTQGCHAYQRQPQAPAIDDMLELLSFFSICNRISVRNKTLILRIKIPETDRANFDTSFLQMIYLNSMNERIDLRSLIHSSKCFSRSSVTWPKKSGHAPGWKHFSITPEKSRILDKPELNARTKITVLKHHSQTNG